MEHVAFLFDENGKISIDSLSVEGGLFDFVDRFPMQTAFFSVTHGGGEGGMPNPYLESKLKVKATTRNMNIIRGIIENY